jgi:uncharacterized protein (DUF2062 family)
MPAFDLRRTLRYYYLRMARLKGEPHDLALGMAIGVFTGMIPILPVQMGLAVVIAYFLRASKLTAAIGTWLSNPFTFTVLYYLYFVIGSWILGHPGTVETFRRIMEIFQQDWSFLEILRDVTALGVWVLESLFLGGFILGIVTAIPSYFICLKAFRFARDWREKRRRLRRWASNPETIG